MQILFRLRAKAGTLNDNVERALIKLPLHSLECALQLLLMRLKLELMRVHHILISRFLVAVHGTLKGTHGCDETAREANDLLAILAPLQLATLSV